MSTKSRAGSKAFNQAKTQGKSREACIQASNSAKEAVNQGYINSSKPSHSYSSPSKSGNSKHGSYHAESDFDSDLNGNGTNWHTAEDL